MCGGQPRTKVVAKLCRVSRVSWEDIKGNRFCKGNEAKTVLTLSHDSVPSHLNEVVFLLGCNLNSTKPHSLSAARASFLHPNARHTINPFEWLLWRFTNQRHQASLKVNVELRKTDLNGGRLAPSQAIQTTSEKTLSWSERRANAQTEELRCHYDSSVFTIRHTKLAQSVPFLKYVYTVNHCPIFYPGGRRRSGYHCLKVSIVFILNSIIVFLISIIIYSIYTVLKHQKQPKEPKSLHKKKVLIYISFHTKNNDFFFFKGWIFDIACRPTCAIY